MLQISSDALRLGLERAQDLFHLNRLRASEDASAGFEAVYSALGLDEEMRERLQRSLEELIPVKGIAHLEVAAAASMRAGVLVGLLIADSALPDEELDLPVLPAT